MNSLKKKNVGIDYAIVVDVNTFMSALLTP